MAFTIRDQVRQNVGITLPFAAALCGGAAFFLRLMELRTGFEVSTGLPIPGNAATVTLWTFCGIACAVLGILAALCLPGQGGNSPAFPFFTDSEFLLTPVVAGGLLLALAGGADLVEGMSQGSLLARIRGASLVNAAILRSSGLGVRVQIFSGLMILAAAFALLLSAAACRGSSGRGAALMLIPAALTVRLVIIYRMDSVNPVLEDYAVELVALVLLTLGFYHLSSFAFAEGSLRVFTFFTCAAEVFCIGAMAEEGRYLSVPLIYLGASLALVGFLLLAYQAPVSGMDAAAGQEAVSDPAAPSAESA